MAERLAASSATVGYERAYAELQHEFALLGGYTLDQRVEPR